MTVQEKVLDLTNTVSDNSASVVARTKAAQQLVETKRKAKKSFDALGVSATVQQQVEQLLNGEDTPTFDGKMPAGVHKLSNMPKGNNVKGKVWTDVDVILPDGSGPVDGRYETKRGSFVYFYVNGQGYRAQHERFVFESGVLALNDRKVD